MTEKIKLIGGPAKTVTWIWLENGQLKVEYYDFSEEAQHFFGNDIAYTLTVTEMEKLYSSSKQNEVSIIPWLTDNFKSYFTIKKWLKEKDVDFYLETESWA